MEPQVHTIDDFRLKIEYLRNSFNFINEKTERTPLNNIKNVDLTGQGDTVNLQSSILNFKFGSSSCSKNLIILEAINTNKKAPRKFS
jgi:hypothetical protein